MENAIMQVGLPVTCRTCGNKGFVKPHTDYAGWYKSKLFRVNRNKWFCPEHYEEGRELDNTFYRNYKTPDPYPEEVSAESTVDELYKLLED